MQDRLELYTSIVPDERQLKIQEMGFYGFIHFGMNTFADVEWGTGKVPAEKFCPKRLDTDQWARSLKSAGMKAAVLTAKHHDGFCLWQTDTTDYSVRFSPYKDGKGDVVKEFSDSCRKYGLEFGIYLSPWDRNSEYYGTDGYNDFYIRQLTELLTKYGDIFSVWLDGACGSWMDGKPKQVYDFERIYRTVRQYQPNAIISNCGPDVRWIGNEAGFTRPSEWNVVPKFSVSAQKVEESSQQSEKGAKKLKTDCVSEDLGSRELLSHYSEFVWYPAEVDVSIRPGWFYHAYEDGKVRSVNNLLNIYCNSVGGNAMLLLNVPPSTEGIIAEPDVIRLNELGARLRSAFSSPVEPVSVSAEENGKEVSADAFANGGNLEFSDRSGEYRVTLRFDKEELIDKIVLAEDITHSQRVENFEVYAIRNGKRKKICAATTIGGKKIEWFRPVLASAVELRIPSCRLNPYLKTFTVYRSDGTRLKKRKFERLVRFIHRVNYKIYVAMSNHGQKK